MKPVLGTGSWHDLWPCGERIPHWSRFADNIYDSYGEPSLFWKECTPRKTYAGTVHEELLPVGRTHVGQVCGGLSPVEVTPLFRGEECE